MISAITAFVPLEFDFVGVEEALVGQARLKVRIFDEANR